VSRADDAVNGGKRHSLKARPVGVPDVGYPLYSASLPHCRAHSAGRYAVSSSSAFGKHPNPASVAPVAGRPIRSCWPGEHKMPGYVPLERLDSGIDSTQQWRAQTRCDTAFICCLEMQTYALLRGHRSKSMSSTTTACLCSSCVTPAPTRHASTPSQGSETHSVITMRFISESVASLHGH
jgi:hypothetical protein